jgi:hypothetical protein
LKYTNELVSIAAKLGDARNKAYYSSISESGMEWGVGGAGNYEGHAHLGVVDVLFAPLGMRIEDPESGMSRGCRLFVAGPNSFFIPRVLNDFWFMKFYMNQSLSIRHPVPDKITEPGLLPADRLPTFVWLDEGAMSLPLFHVPTGEMVVVTYSVAGGPPAFLSVRAGGQDLFMVTA